MSIVRSVKRFQRRIFPKYKRWPDFFICGAARSGTTSLWNYLRQHPDIYMPSDFAQKEPSYFSELYGLRDRHAYLRLFKNSRPDQLLGEASTSYLTSPDSAERIHREVPSARFIILLRNPVDRAYSLYKWMRENGYEPITTFEEALREEGTSRLGPPRFERSHRPEFVRTNGQYYYNYLYFHSGLYHDQVKRYVDLFGREQVMVWVFEEFVADTRAHLRRGFEFLGVDKEFDSEIEVHNATSSRLAIHPGVRSELRQRYQPDIRRLERLLGRCLRPPWI